MDDSHDLVRHMWTAYREGGVELAPPCSRPRREEALTELRRQGIGEQQG